MPSLAKTVMLGKTELALGSPQLGLMRDSSALQADPGALRARMEEDGYLLIRGFHEPQAVLEVRRGILEALAARGQLDPAQPLLEGVINPDKKGPGLATNLTALPAFRDLVEGERVMRWFSEYLGGPAFTFDYKWLRTVPTGGFTAAHYDIVYMGRGTQSLLTLWTPLGATPFEMGGVVVCERSNRLAAFNPLKQTYGRLDVDRDKADGHFTSDPLEILEKFGGRWVTEEFQPGDAVLFGMYTIHMGAANRTNRYRISSDTRYQLASEPKDQRWIGAQPIGHSSPAPAERRSMQSLRAEWGL